MLGLNSDNPLKEKIESLKFSNPKMPSRKSYNKLVGFVGGLEVKEPKWEKLIERAEGGEIDNVQVEILEKKMKEAHAKFDEKLKNFEIKEEEIKSKTSNKKEAERINIIEKAVEDLKTRAEKLEKIIGKTGNAETKSHLEEIRQDLEEEKKASIEELEEVKVNLSN